MKLDPAALNDYQRIMWEKAWRFTNRFLELSTISPAEVVHEGAVDKRGGYHSITYELKLAGDDRRILEFLYVDSLHYPPDMSHPEYAIIKYVQEWQNPINRLEDFLQDCRLIRESGSLLGSIVQQIPDDIPKEIIKSAQGYRDKRLITLRRPKANTDVDTTYVMFLTLLSGEQVSVERAQALGRIEQIVAAHYMK